MTISAPHPVKKPHRFAFRPTTRAGRWAVGMLVAHVLLMFGWSLMGPLGAFPGLLVGLVAGIVALVAIIRYGERALTAFAAVLPLFNVVLFVLAELLIGHD
jgi:hypothetical protein